MKTDKLLQLIQQKKFMRSGGALPLPKAQDGKEKLPEGFMSYESNPGYFDNHAVYHDNARYNDQIRSMVYSGKAAFNPTTGELRFIKGKPADAATQQMATEDYTKGVRRDPTDTQYAGADKRTKQIIQNTTKTAFENPLMYAPGTIGLGMLPTTFGMGYGFSQAGINALQGNYKDAAITAGLSALPFIPHTYKINPWAFKPNPEAYYHRSPNLENAINQETRTLQGFGKSKAGKLFNETSAKPGGGPEVIKQAGTPNEYVSRINLLKPANSELYFAKGTPLDWGRTNMVLDTKTGKMIPGQGYEGPYMIEVTDVPFVGKANGSFTKVFDPEIGQYVKGKLPPSAKGAYAVSKRPISLDEAKFYKEDWLRGYKQISKKDGGSLPKHQGTDKSQTGYNFPWWAVRNPALFLSGFLGSNEENTQPQPVVEKPTRAPFNYDLYNNRASTYLSRPVFEGTPLTGQLIADSARDFYNQTGYEYPLDLLLSQAQFETSMGRKLKSKNNFFNVGNYDDGRTLDYKTPQESLSAYMNLIYNDYLNKGKVPADQLLQPGKFVNTQGKRYASNPNYEKDLSNQSSVIKKTWASDVNKEMNAKKAFGGHIASYQFLGEANEDNNKPKEIRNYVSVPPNTIFPDKAWTSDVIDPNTGVYTMRAETSVPQIFGSTVTALNPKKSSWTQDQNFGANTEGIVEKLELTGDSLGPNLYRETGTACRKPNGEVVPECASGVQLAMDYGTDFGGENRKKLGITGDAWTMGQNVVDAGGSRYYSLVSNDLDKSSLHSNKQVKNYLEDRKTELGIKPLDVYNSAQAGDLVEMWYEGSPSQSKALREGNGAITTHIGIVSVKDGKKYVTHNIHGHWESNPLEKALRKMNVKHGSAVMVSGLVRPDYMDNSKALETVGVQINPEARVYSGSSEETKRNPKETKWKTKTPLSRESQIFTRNLAYYAPQVQQDFGFSDSEMEELMKTSFGLFGKESGFGEGDKFKKKQKFRKLIGKYKDISPDWDYEGDEMSVGKGQIKMDEVFNTPEKKALLEKYGITKDNIWDTGNSAAALLLTTAMNYKNLSSLLGTTFENTDAITLKNILALSHNKGLETVINNEFISEEGDKRRGLEKVFHLLKGDKNWNNDWDKSPTMGATSILEGLRTYSDLHLNPESYSNIFEDYAASLNVNYNKVKENFANKENFKPRTESIPGTIVDAATQGIDNIVTGAQNEVESVVNRGERGVRKMARAPRKVISKIKKELRGTPIFEQGGTVRVQPLSDAQRRYFELLINQKNKK